MQVVILLLFIGGIIYLIRYSGFVRKKDLNEIPVSEIEILLNEKVDFYKKMNSTELKESFKNRVINFIRQVKFTSVGNAKHTLLDEVYIASSAIIPLFAFPQWEYANIKTILLYDDHFDHDYQVDADKKIMGMVGEGAMNHTMILSLKALRAGFEKQDGNQTAIHEFVHLIDKADGAIDGVPEYLLPKELIAPWLRHIRATIQDIKQDETNINPYAATNEAEFFAVISEYFFEKPAMLQKHHPELYNLLSIIFKQK